MKNQHDTQDRHPRAAFWLRAMEMRKHELTHEYRKSLRDKAREGISEEDLRITDETLEKMAKNLGWDESQRHGFHGRPFGFRRHGMMRGFRRGPHPLAGHGHDDHPHDDEPADTTKA